MSAEDHLDADDVILTGEVGKRHPIETEDGPLCPTCQTLLIEPTHEQDCHTCPSLAYKYDYDKQESYTNPHTAPGGDAT